MQAERPPPTYSMRHGAQSGRRGSSTLPVLPSSAPALVDPLLELLADLEERRALGGNLHLGTGLRVPALAGLANLDLEAAEAADLDAVTLTQRVGHAVEDRVHDQLGVLFRDVRHARRDTLDQVTLGHASPTVGRPFRWRGHQRSPDP